MKDTERLWWRVLAYTAVFWRGGIVVSPFINAADPGEFARLFFNKLLTTSLATLLITRCVIWGDGVTPDDYMGKIAESPMACAVVISTLILVLGVVFLFA